MNGRRRAGVGSASLVLIFSVLCLTVFALLSLSTARRDMGLARKQQLSVEEYYAADCEATEVAVSLKQALKRGAVPESVGQVEISRRGDEISYQCPIGSDRALAVTLKSGPDGLQILRWQEIFTGDWEPDGSIDVWTGE